MRTLILTAAALALSGLGQPALAIPGSGSGPSGASAITPTAEMVDDLLWMREEEKLARDVYATFWMAYGTPVFRNIARSEHTHMARLDDALDARNLPDPVIPGIGNFSDPVLDGLFTDLTTQGATLVDAVTVGAFIEELDILDLQHAIDRSIDPQLDGLYEALMCGNRNHLRAFVPQVEGLTGVDYASQVLPQAEVDAILAGPHESCGQP